MTRPRAAERDSGRGVAPFVLGPTVTPAPTRGSTNAENGVRGRRVASRADNLRGPWAIVAVALIVVSIVLVVLTDIRPDYDPYGWLVWGRQTLHWSLDTNGEPSWKPLAFLFTLPYALVGRAQLWLWMVTAVAISLSGPVFAGRVAYKLTGASPNHRHAPVVAGVFAGIALLGLSGYMDYILTARSDPMIVALCLAAVDFHLARRPRVAFVMLLLAALGRPEAWLLVGLYALWAWRSVPPMRALVAAGAMFIPTAWFLVPGLTSKSWFIAGDLALHSAPVRHGNKIFGVVGRFLDLAAAPIELAALAAIALAVWRRDRAVLLVAGAAALWVVVEIAFALHGLSGAPRYMFEPAAVMVVLAAAAVGGVLKVAARSSRPAAAWSGPAAVALLVATLVPSALVRARTEHADLIYERRVARQIDRLPALIRREGGAARIRACGRPAVTALGFQATLAFELGVNVADVAVVPNGSNRSGPVVLFVPHLLGWQVRPLHLLAADRVECNRLRTDTPSG